jgi:hypothetical protein
MRGKCYDRTISVITNAESGYGSALRSSAISESALKLKCVSESGNAGRKAYGWDVFFHMMYFL